jgi:DNA gyrase subunit A
MSRGKAIVNFLELQKDEKVATILPVREFNEDSYVVMATKNGLVKKTELKAYAHPRTAGIIALKILEGDELTMGGNTSTITPISDDEFSTLLRSPPASP